MTKTERRILLPRFPSHFALLLSSSLLIPHFSLLYFTPFYYISVSFLLFFSVLNLFPLSPSRVLVNKWFVSLGHNPSHNLLVISTCPGATVLFPFLHAPHPNSARRVTNCTTLAGSLFRFSVDETSLRNFCWRSSSMKEGRAKFSVGGINPAVHVYSWSLNALRNRARPRSHPSTHTHTHTHTHRPHTRNHRHVHTHTHTHTRTHCVCGGSRRTYLAPRPW